MTTVPYFDVKRQYQNLKEKFEEALERVASSGQYILSDEVRSFESEFARYCGASYAIGVGSGTDALTFSLKALGVREGDEVILPSFTFCATAFSIINVGARPVFVEVDPTTYTLDPTAVLRAITRKTRAILPVHLYGHPADMDALSEIAQKKRLKIVEDACQAHGAAWKRKKTGSMSHAGAFSFYPTKNLGAMGDGGMIVTSDASLVEKVHRLRNLGRKDMSESQKVIGSTSRLDALQAAILRVKLKELDRFNDHRRRVAQHYGKELEGTPLILPEEAKGARHVYHLYVVRVPGGKRDKLRDHLAAEGIPTMIHYPVPVHRLPAIRPYLGKSPRLPLTDKLASEILSLPIFPEMTEEESMIVGKAIQSFFS